jgi:hypothetical protein
MSPLVFDLGINECSPLFLGRDEEMNGETACLACRLLIGIGFEDSEPLPPITEEDSERIWYMELLLLAWERFCSALSSRRFREKKEAFEAVIGVLGVLAFTRLGGGVT